MKVKEPEIPINLCDTCKFKELSKHEELAKCCSNCTGDHPHINATLTYNGKLMINCPYCENLHIHNEPGVYTCGEFLYTVQPKKIIAIIYLDYISVECPWCKKKEYFNSIPTSPYFPSCCQTEMLEIVDTVENIYHSTKRIAQNRLTSI